MARNARLVRGAIVPLIAFALARTDDGGLRSAEQALTVDVQVP